MGWRTRYIRYRIYDMLNIKFIECCRWMFNMTVGKRDFFVALHKNGVINKDSDERVKNCCLYESKFFVHSTGYLTEPFDRYHINIRLPFSDKMVLLSYTKYKKKK